MFEALTAANGLAGIVPNIHCFECSVAFDRDVEPSALWIHGESVRALAGLDRFSHDVPRAVDDGHAVAVRVGDIHQISAGIDGESLRAGSDMQDGDADSLGGVNDRYGVLAVIRDIDF